MIVLAGLPAGSQCARLPLSQYKYQINVDGTVAAYRLPYLLAGSGLVLKQDSEYYEHFYSRLVPMEHYVPFRRNLSDLVDKLSWARAHDGAARQIVRQAQQFALDHLLPHHVLCYYVQLLQEYSAKLKRPPTVREGMQGVQQPGKEPPCGCTRRLGSHDEL